MVCCSDFAGQVRGKGFPRKDLDNRWTKGVGWTPTNIMINCFGEIPATPWGAVGDLVLRPDPAGEVLIDFDDGGPDAHFVEHFILGDIETMDGSPWCCCPRSYLKAALAELARDFGLAVRAAFEHEFTVTSLAPRLGSAYGLEATRQIGVLPDVILTALDRAGLAPDTFLPEYSPGQFEITVDPAPGLEAADRAVKLRQIVRAAAVRCGHRASFSPIMRRGGVGNGVHIHFSLEDVDGQPRSYDVDRPHGIAAAAAPFIAGILAHGQALPAITAPSVISYERIRPNAWSASVTNLGVRDREAFVRVCPVSERPGADVAKQFNFEFRAADSAATPYLALGAIVRAGLDGLHRDLALPAPVSASDAAAMSASARTENGIADLPKSLDAALAMLQRDDGTLMPDAMREPYAMHKHGEIACAGKLDGEALFETYATVY